VSNSESLDDSGNSLTLGDSQNVDHLILVKDRINFNFFFEESLGEIDFLRDVSSVDLDFDDVIFLLSEVQQFHLGVGNNSDDGAIFFNSVQFNVNVSLGFSYVFLVFSESLLLRIAPVLIESSQSVSIQLISPNSGQSSQSSGSFNVSNQTNNNHRGSFNNSNSFDDFLFV
jgi:hypothetical protein